jgi:putative NADPH-quinone reductase
MKTILILNAHPNKKSFCSALAESYLNGAQSSNADIKLINLIDLNFDPILKTTNSQDTELEPDILKVQKEISKADHLVFVYPNWWGTYPALLKGFFDRVFTSGFAFRYRTKNPLPEKLLTGKSARVIVTMDTPAWYYSIGYRKPGHNSMKKSILGLCGITPVKFTTLAPIRNSSVEQRNKWLEKVNALGRKMI